MTSPLFQVDAFTDTAFTGNPAAVCLLHKPAYREWMQLVAREMNLSETAFVWPEGDAYRLRWFTPQAEVDLCGHATLATAHVLWESGRLELGAPAVFETRSGTLTARQSEAGIELDFPADPVEAVNPPMGLLESLGIAEAGFVGRTTARYFVEVGDEATVRALQPDFAALQRVAPGRVVVTARADSEDDFVSRYFAPGIGIPEDPVTGSTHCILGPYWAQKLGKTTLRAYQASERGGRLTVEVRGERIALTGGAVTVVRGELLV